MSRLKRKLENAFDGNLPSNLKLNENFCLIGTPLPPLEKSKDTGEFVPLWKQEVRDEKGRRRLHGAFTGGFSAGYFNTVGSKEGWAPSTFTSSRGERAAHKAARPEDFMDDEDLAEIRESQKLVDTTEEMDLTGGTQAELARRAGAGDGPKDEITSALEDALLPTARDSVGARILKKMGWRPGQGVGPRVTWAQLKAQDAQSSSLSSADASKAVAPEHEEATKHTYAPRDTKLPVFTRKTNNQGIGYTPGATLHESTQGTAKTGPSISAGFGLGALNEADDDDIDIYDSTGGPSRATRLAYDVRDVEDDERPTLGPRRPNIANAFKAPQATSSEPPATFHDGRRVISGFVISSAKVSEDTLFPLPEIPPGWKPDPTRVWKTDASATTPAPAAASPPREGNWKNTITAEQRGSMLGETPLPAAPRSVFDYLSQKDRDRLRAMASGIVGAAPPPPVAIVVPTVEPRIAQAALKGFQPFVSDPAKQARYTSYLRSQVGGEEAEAAVPLTPKPGQSNEAFNQELAEYANAARIFKPVSGAMASRFTSAAVVEAGPKAVEGLHQPSASSSSTGPGTGTGMVEKMRLEDPPKLQAAKAGMFGPLTHETEAWFPARLLCKRFGVPDPHPDGAAAEAAAQAKKDKETQFEQETKRLAADAVAAAASSAAADPDGDGEGVGDGRKKDLSNVGLGEDETQGRDTLTYERPAMDIFKAIFASDDEESEDEAEATAAPGAESATRPAIKAETSPPPAVDEPVDLASFRPTFVSRVKREGKAEDAVPKDKEKEKKGKRDKTKSKSKFSLVSFGDEDGDGLEGPAAPPSTDVEERKHKKKRKSKRASERGGADDDDGMWVEKEVPQAVKPVAADVPQAPDAGARGRKRAIDFL
ncbi:DUF1604-domain-containing protein [Exidia glandulosa HHB12029]|uniref:DUF1604-domain-containing protein n=1 Tax=Exidia glandulosa HHB12029 TaxID=1314781 RepID=A0A165KJP8_EXIGL|nr:DUF1604-domain-containing protein [Exidia glandulosa HHB12029]